MKRNAPARYGMMCSPSCGLGLFVAVLCGCGPGIQTIYEGDDERVIALKKMGVIVYEGAGVGAGEVKYEIDFSKTELTPEAWDVMKELVVDKLVLTDTDFSDADVQRLTDHENLRVLDLTNTSISDAALETLVNLGRLSELTLAGTSVTDAGLKILSRLKRLTLLNLMDTQVTDAGLPSLKELPSLNILVLSENPRITDTGLKHLADCPKLSMLGVYNTQVTTAGIAEVKKSHPTLMAMGAR